MQSIITNRNIQLTFIGIVLFIFFLGNYQFSLWDNSESEVALMAQRFVQHGGWKPIFFSFSDGISFHPLQIWETALSYRIFGVNEFATRLPALLYVVLTLLTLFYFARNWYNEKTAILAVVILSSSFLLPILAKVNLAESGLLFYATVMFGSFWSSLKAKDLKMTIAFWIAALLSTFHGGFVAVITFVGAWSVLFFIKKDWRQALMNIQPYLIIVAIIPIIAWTLISKESIENSNIPSPYFDETFLNPSTSINFGHQTFLLLIGFLPWIAFLPSSLVRLVKDIMKREETALFFGSWIAFGYILFEFLPTSMQFPAVVVLPAIVLLMAQKFWDYEAACERFQNAPINEHLTIRAKKAGFKEENIIKTSQLLGVIGVFFIMFILSMIGYSQGVGILKTGFSGMILWITSFIVAIGFYARNSNLVFYGSVTGGLLFVLFAWLLVVPVLEPARSFTKRTAEAIEKLEDKGTVLVVVSGDYALSSLPFYLNTNKVDIMFLSEKSDIEYFYLDDKKHTFILDDYQYKALKETANSSKYKATRIEPIEGILIKNRKAGNYWILQE